MDIAAIVSEIDGEIEKLFKIREIIQALSAEPVRLQRNRKPTPIRHKTADLPKAHIEQLPRIVVLPPKAKREYRTRTGPVFKLPNALAPAPSNKPVFVRRVGVPNADPVLSTPTLSEEALEAAIRRKLAADVA